MLQVSETNLLPNYFIDRHLLFSSRDDEGADAEDQAQEASLLREEECNRCSYYINIV